MPINTPTHKHYKAITNEASVNPKNRFNKNNIEWVEDLTYRGTSNKAFFIKLPVTMTLKPPGCKKMHFIKYFPGPDEEYITHIDAGIFYSTVYPRYEHVAEALIENNAQLIQWPVLDEAHKQHFVKIWGKHIVEDLINLNWWRIHNNKDDHYLTTPKPRPKDVGKLENESVLSFIEEAERTTVEISCLNDDMQRLLTSLTYDCPQIYVTKKQEYEQATSN